MIRHVALFRFKPEFGKTQRNTWVEMIRELPNEIPEIKSLTIGENVLTHPNAYEIALVIDFYSIEDLETYNQHPLHQEILKISGPVKEALAVVDFKI